MSSENTPTSAAVLSLTKSSNWANSTAPTSVQITEDDARFLFDLVVKLAKLRHPNARMDSAYSVRYDMPDSDVHAVALYEPDCDRIFMIRKGDGCSAHLCMAHEYVMVGHEHIYAEVRKELENEFIALQP